MSHEWESIEAEEKIGPPEKKLMSAYTVSSRTNMSFLGSFMRLSHSQLMRKATLEGWPELESTDGREILCLRSFEKRSSRPPLEPQK